MLIAIVDAHVGIGRPNQHRVNASVSLIEVIQITVDGIFMGDRSRRNMILHHHLRLDECGLRPFERRQAISGIVKAINGERIGQPLLMVALRCRVCRDLAGQTQG